MVFSGWPAEAIEFYEGLAADNSKSYWQAHKAVYDELVYRPMTELLAELEPEFGDGKIFRPYRDIRFSRDKSPYKTAIAATLADGGYVQFSADGLSAGCGKYMLSPGQLDRYRRAVADDGSGADAGRNRGGGAAGRPRRCRARHAQDLPEGLPQGSSARRPAPLQGPDHLAAVAGGAWLGTAEAKTRIVDFLHASAPLKDWLAIHVGPDVGPPSP